MRVCNENLFINAYGYCVYPGCKHMCACSMLHETIVALITSLLCSLYPSSYRGVVCTSRYLRLCVVHMSSFCLIAVLPTTLIIRTFARYSLFIFCIFYNALYIGIILVTESFVAFSTIIAWSYRAWQQTLCVSYYNIIYVLFLPLFTQQKHRVSASSRSKLAKIVATLRCFYHISRVLQPKNYTAQKIHRFLRCICVIPTFSHFCMSTRWERLSRALRPLFLALAVLSACCIDRNNVARLNEGWHLHYQARLQRRIFEYTAGCITFYNIFGVGDLKVEILG